MFRSLCVSAVLALAAVSASNAQATTVEVVSGTRAASIAYFGPIGQSFTAADSLLSSFGFQFQALNPGSANDPITLTLRQGEGLTGTTLVTRTATIPSSINSQVPTWFDFDLGGIAVSLGSVYTAVLTTTASFRNGVTFGPNLNIYTGVPLTGDAYAGGKLIGNVDPFCTNGGTCDLNFRVTGSTPDAVPEPSTLAVMTVGLGLAGGALRRRRRAA